MNINDEYLPISNEVEKYDGCEQFVKRLKTLFNFFTLDTNLYDLRRCWKVAYSLDTKTGYIALPLSDAEFVNFSYDIVKPENVLKMNVMNRGLLKRNGLAGGFKKFCKEYEIW